MFENMRYHFRFFTRRRVALLMAVLCCAAIIATGTLAYFTTEETSYNIITTGELSMELKEDTTGGVPFPSGGISGVTPGTVVDKIPYVVNNGGIDFYTRAAVSVKVTGADGAALSAEYIRLDINTTDWTEKDGFYYYNKVLAPGEQTEPLFTKVTFDREMHNAYQKARTEIDVTAQAVQSKNNGEGPLDEGVVWSQGE